MGTKRTTTSSGNSRNTFSRNTNGKTVQSHSSKSGNIRTTSSRPSNGPTKITKTYTNSSGYVTRKTISPKKVRTKVVKTKVIKPTKFKAPPKTKLYKPRATPRTKNVNRRRTTKSKPLSLTATVWIFGFIFLAIILSHI